MAAVLDKKDPAAKFGSQVDEQLAETTSRIRFHDLAFGGLVLGAMILVYATAMILLDRYLVLPEWVRQLALGGFVLAVAGVGYFTIVRPLRRQINPLYAAVQVERTIDDPKNSVVGYVDTREKSDLHPSVKAAMTTRAAKSMGKADLNRAVDHRSLIYAAAVAVVFLLALIVLFFVFRPSQFASLAGRTFVPFSSDAIATRTKLTLIKPESGDLTITAGQSVTIGVHVGGKIPDPETPARLRVLIRHNPADPNYETVALEKGDDSRDWQIRVPDHLVQNGFWYKVAGGDAVTPEYRITVRSLPLFTDFETTYEYPAYLRRPPRTDRNPWLDGPRGTKVVLIARTNREVKDGRMVVELPGEKPTIERVEGGPVPGRPDSLRFELKLTANGAYKLSFTSTTGERNADPPPYSIRIIEDARPTVEITAPEEPQVRLPANGQLKVDGTVGDDYGIVKVMLRMRVVTENDPPRPLKDLRYLDGKSLLREKDNSYPTDLLYKGSVDLAKVTDVKGQKIELKAGMEIEYWLEALDNCTETKLSDEAAATWESAFGNVGKSQVKRLILGEPKTSEQDKETLDQQKAQRQQQEQDHNQRQQDKFNKEDRNRDTKQPPQAGTEGAKGDNPPKQDANQQNKTEPKKNEDGKGPPMGNEGAGDPMTPKDPENKGANTTPKNDGTGMTDPNMNPNPGNMGTPETAPPPSTPEDKDVQRKADKLQDEINKQQQGPGQGRANPNASESERTNPDQPKEQPPGGPPPDASQTKKEPMNPMGGPDPAQSKPEGNVEPPPPPSESKSDPKPADPMGGNNQEPGQAKKPPEELGGLQAGKEQPEPKQPEPGMQEPKGGSQSAGDAKPATDKKSGDPMPGAPQPDPTAGAGTPKPQPQNDRGTEKDPAAQPQPNAGEKSDTGNGKPEKAPDPAAAKPGPQNDPMTKPDADPPKPETGKGPEASDKPNTPQPGGANDQKVEPGEEKPSPDATGQPNGGGQPDQKKIQDAARNLNNPDDGTRNRAKGELDREIGPKRRQQAEDLSDDLNSKDEQKRKDAEHKLERLTREAQQEKQDRQKKDAQANKGQPEKKDNTEELRKKNKDNQGSSGQSGDIDPKDAGQAAKDLASGDQAKKDAARDKLDRSVGKDARQQAEKEAQQIEKDLKSDDKHTREAAQKKLDELANNTEKQADEMAKKNRGAQAKKDEGKGPGKEPTKEEIEAMKKKLEDLASDDKNKREAAEKEFDEKIGKENREKLQQALKDAQSGDPQQQQEAREKLQQMMANNGPLDGKRVPPKGTASQDMPLPKPYEDDPKNRLKSAELQLRQFKDVKDDPELLKRAGFENEEEYARFLKGFNEMVERLQNQVAEADKQPPESPGAPTGPVQNVSEARKLDQRKAEKTDASVSGPGFAAPGFGNAQQTFQQKAIQVTKPK
jgi:hypothetical protein